MFSKPKKIGKLEIKNRFVRSVTFKGLASEDGKITKQLIDFYKTLSKGGTKRGNFGIKIFITN